MTFRGSTQATQDPDRITSWSYSRLRTFNNCPFKAKLLYIDGKKEEPSEQMQEGFRIHKLAEDFLLSDAVHLEVPPELKRFGEDYKALRQQRMAYPDTVLVESGLAFTKDLQPCDWYDKDRAWLRVKFDAVVLDLANKYATVIDLKTGKVRQEDDEQLDLFAWGIMLAYPEIDEVGSELWYSASGKVTRATHKREFINAVESKWRSKSDLMLTATEFLPNPNPFCRRCDFRASNGGPCKFS